MGLDISFYRQIKLEAGIETDEYGDPADCYNLFKAYVNADFPDHADSIQDGGIYSYAETDGFSAGPYSSYNRWREWLAGLVNTTPEDCWQGAVSPDALVFDLINFSDCEGIIGSKTSAKLAQDIAMITPIGDDHQIKLFHKFKQAFETAADSGCVVFH